MAVSAIIRQSEDKIMRQAYQRRKDEIYFNNLERAEDRLRADQAEHRADQAEAQLADKDKIIAQLQAQLSSTMRKQ